VSALTPHLVTGDGREQVFSCLGKLGDPVEHPDGHQCQLWRAVRQSDIPGEEEERGIRMDRKDECRQTHRQTDRQRGIYLATLTRWSALPVRGLIPSRR